MAVNIHEKFSTKSIYLDGKNEQKAMLTKIQVFNLFVMFTRRSEKSRKMRKEPKKKRKEGREPSRLNGKRRVG